MSTDLKIELFSKDLFNYLWEHHGLEKPSEFKLPPRKSEFNEKIFHAVQSRQAMFAYPYETIFENTHGDFVGNSTEFFDMIVYQFPHYIEWAKNPNPEMVMSLFLNSCAFVASLCMWCKTKDDYFLDVGPKAWAMFVDMHVKEQFYSHGGWKKLLKFVDHDAVVHDYMKAFSKVVDCDLGKGVMIHAPHMTCGAVESFDEFEAWEGVDADAPMALKWVDYCVQVPFMKIRNVKYYKEPVGEVFQKIEDAMLDLGYILDPDREGDYFDGNSDVLESPTASPKPASPRKSQSTPRQSKCWKEGYSSFPIAPISHLDVVPTQGIAENYGFDSDGEVKSATNPENILKTPKTFKDPARVTRLAADDRICSIYNERKASQKPKIDSLVTEKVKPSKSSGVVDHEKCGVLKPSSEEVNGSKAKKTLKVSLLNDSKNLSQVDSGSLIQSNTSDKNECPIQQIPIYLSDNKVDLDTRLEEAESGLLSIGFAITPNDHNDSQLNTHINYIDTVMEQLGREKFSEYVPLDSKRRVDVYMKTVDLDNIAVLGDIEDTTVKSPPPNVLSSPRKSLTSPNINASSAPCKSPLTSSNVNALSAPRKSPHTSPNVAVLSTPRKSLTTPYINVLSTPRKSLTSPNVNALSTPRKSPLTSPNVNVLSAPRKSPLTSPNINALSNPDDLLFKKINTSGLSGSKTRSPTGKENSPSNISKSEIKKKSPHQKNVKVHSISPNSRKEADVQKLKRIKNKCPLKDSFCPVELYLDIDDPSKDEKKPLIHLPTPQPLKIDKGVKRDYTNFLKSFLKSPSSDPMWSGLDVCHQNSVLVDDDVVNDNILEKSMKLLEPSNKEDLSRPSKEGEYRLGDRLISQDRSREEIYQVIRGENSSADSTEENQFKLAPGFEETKNNAEIALDCGKSLKTENEMTSEEITDENPFGFDGQKAKKSKQDASSYGLNNEALQTSQSEPVLENSKPQDVEKKGKKKRTKKRLTRLEQRIKEEGNGVIDVTRLIFVMGHRPGMASVASAFHDSKNLIHKGNNNNYI